MRKIRHQLGLSRQTHADLVKEIYEYSEITRNGSEFSII